MDPQQTHAQKYYDNFSQRYEDKREVGYHKLIDDLAFEVVRPYAQGAKVLEAGCGTGLILDRVSRIAKVARGVDLSPGMLAKARSRGLDVQEGSVTDLPVKDDAFDLVYCFKVLAHVPDLGRALSEFARVTRPGGTIVIDLYNRLSLRYLAKRLGGPGWTGVGQRESDLYTRWDTPATIARVLPPSLRVVKTAGIRIVSPSASLYRLPVVSTVLRQSEEALMWSPLRHFGGFLVTIIEKSGSHDPV